MSSRQVDKVANLKPVAFLARLGKVVVVLQRVANRSVKRSILAEIHREAVSSERRVIV